MGTGCPWGETALTILLSPTRPQQPRPVQSSPTRWSLEAGRNIHVKGPWGLREAKT